MNANVRQTHVAQPGHDSSASSGEQEAVRALHSALIPCGMSRSEAVAIWIGLKSKPGMILRAPHTSLADRMSNRIARTVLDTDDHRLMQLIGHPWWANHGPNQAQLVSMQQRLTSLQLRSFLIRAAQIGEKGFPHFVLLHGIGRTELYTIFVLIPRQIRTLGGVIELPYDFAGVPTPISENVFLLATLKQHIGIINRPEILDFCTILSFEGPSQSTLGSGDRYSRNGAALQITLSACRNFNPLEARSLLPTNHKHAALALVGELLALLDKQDIKLGSGLIKDAYLYLGHAWDMNGEGLFDNHPKVNLHSAGDFWLTQSVIPRLWDKARMRVSLQELFLRLLTNRYSKAEIIWRGLLESTNR